MAPKNYTIITNNTNTTTTNTYYTILYEPTT